MIQATIAREVFGGELVRMGGEPADHGAELIGASGMCCAWADGIEEIEEDV
jgi:hypothetical protein